MSHFVGFCRSQAAKCAAVKLSILALILLKISRQGLFVFCFVLVPTTIANAIEMQKSIFMQLKKIQLNSKVEILDSLLVLYTFVTDGQREKKCGDIESFG